MPAQRIKPPTGAAEKIKEMASVGAGTRGISSFFKISQPTFFRWIADYPTLKQAYEEGLEVERNALHGAMHKQAINGNVLAGIFLLKSRHRYQEDDKKDGANKLNITFNLPGALKPAEYKTLEANAAPQKPLLERG